ncbi:MAG: hypothetical protein JSU63_17195 [Phycisphaerales bacterium]|nr:MAG: hypothetical protein JSU63_17195 [Phycisphaerales bacterium]
MKTFFHIASELANSSSRQVLSIGRRSSACVLNLILAVSAPLSAAASACEDPRIILAPDAPSRAFLVELATLVTHAEQRQQHVVRGKDGWLFFVPELRSVCAGPFWGAAAPKVSRAPDPRYADPIGPIVDFDRQLKQVGVRLLLVPVPAKTHVYPDRLSASLSVESYKDLPRFDLWHQQFFALLRDCSVDVLDLLPLLAEHREDPEGGVYCKTDSHWSPRACALVADLIAEHELDRVSFAKSGFVTEQRRIEISGDLARMSGSPTPAREKLLVTFVGRRVGEILHPLEPDRQSPVVLMGDSHVLVFHDPALYTRGAGLPDHLARRFGFPVDLIGVRGSGVNVPRITLMRRRDSLRGKKLIIWCLSVREFTENESGWRRIPVVRHNLQTE